MAALRQAEEGLSAVEAARAVLRDNLFELDSALRKQLENTVRDARKTTFLCLLIALSMALHPDMWAEWL